MSTGHSHGQVRTGHEKTLWIALALTTTFLIVEVIGAFVTGSLALLSDAAHMFTDAAALAISLAVCPTALAQSVRVAVIHAPQQSEAARRLRHALDE